MAVVAVQGPDVAVESVDSVPVGPCSVVAAAGSVVPGTAGEHQT